jgi:hypothetical protein
MSNSYSQISTGNTFGQWVVTTNALVFENNSFDSSDYHKRTGILYLDSSPTSLQSNGTSIFQAQLHSTGTQGTLIDYNLTVGGQTYLSNTSLSLTASGQANMNGLLIAQGPGTSLYVANNANVQGNLSIVGNTAIGNNLTITYNTTTGNAFSLGTTVTNTLQSNVSINTATLSVVGTTYSDKIQGNTSVNTATLTVTGNSFTNVLQSNTSVNTATLSVVGTTYTNVLQANTSANTGTLSVTGTSYTNVLQGNTSVNTATLSVTGTSYTNVLQANTSANTGTLSVTGTTFTNVLQGNTSVNTATLSVTGTSYTNVLQGNTSVNTATLSVTGTAYSDKTQANTSVNTATLFVTGISYSDKKQANTSVNTATLTVTGTSYTNVLQANTSANTGTLSVTGTSYTNVLQSNTSVNTATLTVTGNSYTNVLQANTSANTGTLSVTGTTFTGNLSVTGATYTNVLQSNTSVNTATLTVTGNSYTNVLQSNTSVNTSVLSVVGTTYTNVLQANTSANTGTLSVTGTSYTNVLQGNTSVNTATLSVTGTSYTNVLQANTSANTGTLSVTGTTFTNVLQGNTSVNTATLSVTGTSYTNVLQGNTSVNTATLSVTGTSYTNVLQSNTSVNTATLTVTGNVYANNISSNTSINTASLTVTNNITSSNVTTSNNLYVSGNTYLTKSLATGSDVSVGGNLIVPNSLLMGGSTSSANIYSLTIPPNGSFTNCGQFIQSSPLVYNSKDLTLSAASPVTSGNFVTINANRYPSTNATIRWNETIKYWEIINVSSNFANQITTNALFSLSGTDSSQSNVATAYALSSANTFLQSFTNSNISANVSTLNSTISTLYAKTGGLISGDVSITGNLYVNGTQSYVNTATFQTVDSLIELAANNVTDSVDIGFYGQYGSSGTKYTGLVRTAASNYTLFQGITNNPTTNSIGTITSTNFATLNANLTGGTVTGLASAIPYGSGGTGSTSYTTGQILIAGSSGLQSLPNVTACGPVGSSTSIPVITTDGYGRVTSLTSCPVTTTVSLCGNTGTGAFSGGGTLTITGGNGVAVAVSGSTATICTPQSLCTTSNPTFACLTVTCITGCGNALTCIPLTSSVTGTLPYTNGGTGSTSYTTGRVLIAGASGFQSLANVTACGPVGSSTSIPVVTVDSYGRVTNLSTASISTTLSTSGTNGTGSVALASQTLQVTSDASSVIQTTVSSNTVTINSIPSGVTAGSYGNASCNPTLTVDTYGRITSVTNCAISIPSGSVSGLAASATTDTTCATNITCGTLSASRLPATTVTPGSYGCVTGTSRATVCVPSFTVDGQGRLTSAGQCLLQNQPTLCGNSGTGYFDTIGVSANPTWCFPGSNGVTTTVATNKVTITIPQCIDTTSCPTFAGLCSTGILSSTERICSTLNNNFFYPLNLTNCCSYAASIVSTSGIIIANNDGTGGTAYRGQQISTGYQSFSIGVQSSCACFVNTATATCLVIPGVYYGNGAGLTYIPAANVTGTLNSSVALNSSQITTALTYTPAPCVPVGSCGCILKGNASGGFTNATGADVVALLSTCNITVGTIASSTQALTYNSGTYNLTNIKQGIQLNQTFTTVGTYTTNISTIGIYAQSNYYISTNNGGGTQYNFNFDTTGSFTAPGNVTAYSDARLKTNVQTITGALDKVSALRGVSYEKDGQCGVGVIAQEVQQVLPEVVHEGDDEDKTLSVAYGNISGVLIEAIKELTAQVNELKAEIEELKKR